MFGQDLQVLVGWVYTKGISNREGWHCFTPYGTPISGWFFDINNEIYYLDNGFIMVAGSVQIDGIIRKFDINGLTKGSLVSNIPSMIKIISTQPLTVLIKYDIMHN